MDFYEEIIDGLKQTYDNDDNALALFVTGSFARGDILPGNDLDTILLVKNRIPNQEFRKNGVLLEIGVATVESMMTSVDENIAKTYMWLDTKAIFDKGNYLSQIQQKSHEKLASYKPTPDERQGMKKWLTSVVDKITAGKNGNDMAYMSFNNSSHLWKTLEGLYMINNMPTPASTRAFRTVTTLSTLPENFTELWKKILLGDTMERAESTLTVLQFVIAQL